MSWIELSLDTTSEAVDWVCTLLASTSYISDIRVIKYTQPNSNDVENTWSSSIYFYIPNDSHHSKDIARIANLLSPLQRTGLTTELQTLVVVEKREDASILSSPVRIGERFVVIAPDAIYQPETPQEVILKLKTTLAFGSGLHPATILAMRLIEKHIIAGTNVLDLGSGSGILSVAMAKLGASVLAVDNDVVAVESTQDAVKRNDVEQQVTVVQGSLGKGSQMGHWMGGDVTGDVIQITQESKFDAIVANILGRMHVDLTRDYCHSLRPGAILITSGFTEEYKESITTTFAEEKLELIDCQQCNEWLALVHRLQM